MFNKKTITDIDVKGKRVLVRVDYNVPIKDDKVTDDTRIVAAMPTLDFLVDHGAAVILFSHLGRPKGGPDPKFSLKPVAAHLSGLLGRPVAFAEDCVGPIAEAAARAIKPGEILVLENTRFHPEEEKNDPELAKKMASLADIYVNDAFGSAHRAHASTEGVAHYLPAVAGFLMEKEIKYLGQAIANPKHPFVAILGGAKISDKIGVIRNLLIKADQILIGGGMANTFFKAQGYPVGDSLCEEEALDTARQLLQSGTTHLRLPVDVVIGDRFDAEAEKKIMPMGPVPDGWRILDIGPATVVNFSKTLAGAETIVWNGPMGVFEFPRFAEGTIGIAKAVADSKAVSIIGGGDSVAAINQAGLAGEITHISTGGGASLEMLEGLDLPGLVALQDK
ncbi:MAG: phosphoglycerate kinase [Chloroflexi bacterium RBG_16_47_49]|nr:MAG: phosphoglycerate kinase [Chloroflexi bacterium RBG_16_47_49]